MEDATTTKTTLCLWLVWFVWTFASLTSRYAQEDSFVAVFYNKTQTHTQCASACDRTRHKTAPIAQRFVYSCWNRSLSSSAAKMKGRHRAKASWWFNNQPKPTQDPRTSPPAKRFYMVGRYVVCVIAAPVLLFVLLGFKCLTWQHWVSGASAHM